ncbi:MAG: zinc ABC transporter substrate-binding protein [Hyphomicrobiaceae bacterium]|nr:zinc ABC transporter substrate-binding protein [Hyphomicrobiaceae bacterium]
MWKRFAHRNLVLVLALIIAALVTIETSTPGNSTEPLDVVATTSMIADTVSQIGGSLVKVKALIGPGLDPHSYRQTRSDIISLSRADLILWHGLHLEAQLEEFLKRLTRKKTVVAVAEHLPKELLLSHDDYNEKFDPHVWMHPSLWSRIVIIIRDTLIKVLPQEEIFFRDKTDKYLTKLDQLSIYSRRVLSSIAPEKRILLSAHDAFNYFGKAYNFQVIGIQGVSTESEAGLKRISDLANFIAKRKISAVFVESSMSDRNIRALIEGAAAQGHNVIIGGKLFSDAMGENGSYEGSYIGMIDHNVTKITRALGGQAPIKGMSNKLS